MDLSTLIRLELDKRGIRTLKEAGSYLGVSTETIRLMLNRGHSPKDKTLLRFARVLGLDPSLLLTASHRQRLPAELRDEMLSVASPPGGQWEKKRKWPLSQEQCDYLGRVMQPHEIQFIRKYRQLNAESKQQTVGYVEYMFATCRVARPAEVGEKRGEDTEKPA